LILTVFFFLILISCNDSNKKENSSNIESLNEKTVFRVLDSSSRDIEDFNYKGQIINTKCWIDSNSENIVLFTKREHELFVYHYIIQSGSIKLLRDVYDFSEKGCEYDLFADFIKDSITVTDLDNNNFGEITFAYNLACISDLSPIVLKLLILENGNKYIIRGHSKIVLGDETIGGDKNIDSSFVKASPEFLEFANKVWADITIKTMHDIQYIK